MIQGPPLNWRDLQSAAAQILNEAGVEAATDQIVQTARGSVAIDVVAVDYLATPDQRYFLECKHWTRNVPKAVVHAFRTVIGDSGANWAAIVALNGFQPGAIEAARYSNVRLLTWTEFEALFVRRWFSRYFLPAISRVAGPLIEYTEPINSRVQRKARALSQDRQREYLALRDRYHWLLALCTLFCGYSVLSESRLAVDGACDDLGSFPRLPLRGSVPNLASEAPVSAPIAQAEHLRDLLAATTQATNMAVAEFDSVFGERA